MEGLWTVFGPILTIAIAILTKNAILALLFGICYFSIGTYGLDFLNHIADAFASGFNNNGFIIIMVAVLGVLLVIMRKGGGFKAFAGWANKKVASKKQAGLLVVGLSVLLTCASDLISNLATGKT